MAYETMKPFVEAEPLVFLPSNDFVFKTIFLSPGNALCLQDFLACVLHLPADICISSDIGNSEIFRINEGSKAAL